jgi:riboflavin kinase/FMN adenylyltransferase
MKIYTSLADIPAPFGKSFVTIGNFDGVHLGHQMLFAEVVSRAQQGQGTSVAVTFEPHPLQVIRPEIGLKLISSYEQKVEMITLAGIEVLVVIPFTREFAATGAETFVDEVLVGTIGIRELVVGYDYAFGKGRQGNIDFLKEKGQRKGFPVTVSAAATRSGVRCRRAGSGAARWSVSRQPTFTSPKRISARSTASMSPRLSMTVSATAAS